MKIYLKYDYEIPGFPKVYGTESRDIVVTKSDYESLGLTQKSLISDAVKIFMILYITGEQHFPVVVEREDNSIIFYTNNPFAMYIIFQNITVHASFN